MYELFIILPLKKEKIEEQKGMVWLRLEFMKVLLWDTASFQNAPPILRILFSSKIEQITHENSGAWKQNPSKNSSPHFD